MRRRFKWLLAGSLTVGLVGYYGLLPVKRVVDLLHPPRARVGGLPGPAYEAVTFATSDGLRLAGWYVPSKNRAAIILTHGFGGNRAQLLDQAEALVRVGFGVLLYDSRAHGDSQGDESTRGWLEANDLLGALAYVQKRPEVDPERIGAFGFSIGGQVTIRVAAQTQAIQAVAADGPSTATFEDGAPPETLTEWLSLPASWVFYEALSVLSGAPIPESVLSALPRIAPRPLLLITSGVQAELRVVRNYESVAHAPKILWEISDVGHGGGFGAHPKEYADRLIRFFEDALLPPPF